MQVYFELLGRTFMAFIALLLVSRILGKQTISNMTFHDFATGIMMGAIAANLAFNRQFPAVYFLICLVLLTLISYTSSGISLKFPKTRHWLSGAPTVVIDKGNILEANMRKIHYTLDSLNQSLREKDVFDLNEVDYAILETNGQLSVKKKEQFRSATKQDVHIKPSHSILPIELVMDGQILHRNLDQNHISEEWLMQQINNKGKEAHDIFYAVKSTNGNLIFDYYQDELSNPIDKE
ncbi:DUF421 domain-containing protein [Paenibacillus macquariensis]|uniref:Uncharacterized membrane protein YcaP, DUF421 family n=1 Tax=Paenibacillus macquariensis TaxID=948756 RepID=A0ABY1JP14_9BACL|nr:DUF421 domain-containing protein [Paenibacillus macquariensis]MEC0092078.1 DUF421 domain-containing protein [Paenibacillus macquariensis]OAB37356.1 hypothetical protein PMSM_04630 [Paenibacillus macquariensis subsp. macquariensis]SIQ51540.1 Uncharacterized membrane protein YcaP, DUF421 family [Paenibacillus macquariensis]